MRTFLTLLVLSLPLKVWAACPSNKDVIPVLKDIHKYLMSPSKEPLSINGKKYRVSPGKDGKAAEGLLAGEYRGYFLDRFKETTPGACTYRVWDDRSPASGRFILSEVPEAE